MSPTGITQTENEGGHCNKNADSQNPQMPTMLDSKPEVGSWHESERERFVGTKTEGMESGPPGPRTFPIGTTSLQYLCAHYSSLTPAQTAPCLYWSE